MIPAASTSTSTSKDEQGPTPHPAGVEGTGGSSFPYAAPASPIPKPSGPTPSPDPPVDPPSPPQAVSQPLTLYEYTDDPLAARKTHKTAHRLPYSPAWGDVVAEHYQMGMSMREIAALPGMPNEASLYAWMRGNPGFAEIMHAAKKSRALAAENEAVDVARSVKDKADVPAARLKTDVARWVAAVNDPDRYGNKTQVSGDPDKPVRWVVVTGVPKPATPQPRLELGEDGRVIEVPCEVVSDAPEPDTDKPDDPSPGGDIPIPARKELVEEQVC